MNAQERREFVRTHRTAIFGYTRKQDGPAMTVIYYVMDGDDILVSTMAARAKARAVARNPKVSLCVLDEKWPLTYVVVYGTARIERDVEKAVDLMTRIYGLMAGNAMPTSTRPEIEATARREERVVVRITPYATFETPPRHVYKPEDARGLTHSLGTTLPWSG